MKNLKALGISITLVCLMSMTTLADGNDACIPGATNSPPCAVSQLTADDSAPTADPDASASVIDSDVYLTKVAIDLMQSVLSVL
jgi:hypothetical protein